MDDPGERRSGFAVVDVETTGFTPDLERIVEVGVVVLDPSGHEMASFCTLVDPGCDPGPTHVHGISSDMLVGAPSFGAIHPYLAELLSGRVVVGHNIDQFDLGFMRAECRRLGGEVLVPGSIPSIDTLVVAQHHLGLAGRARLFECCDRYGLSWDDHHSALGDARVTGALLRAMRTELGDGALGIADLLSVAHRSAWPGASGVRPMVWGRAGSLTG